MPQAEPNSPLNDFD